MRRVPWHLSKSMAIAAMGCLAFSSQAASDEPPPKSVPPEFNHVTLAKDQTILAATWKSLEEIAAEYRDRCGIPVDLARVTQADRETLTEMILRDWAQMDPGAPFGLSLQFAEADLACLRLARSPDLADVEALLSLVPSAPPIWLFHLHQHTIVQNSWGGDQSRTWTQEEWACLAGTLVEAYAKTVETQPPDALHLSTGWLSGHRGHGVELWHMVCTSTVAWLGIVEKRGRLRHETVARLVRQRMESGETQPVALPFLRALLDRMEVYEAAWKGLQPTPPPDPGIPDYKGTEQDPRFQVAAQRFAKLRSLLMILGTGQKWYPLTLEELIAEFPDEKLPPEALIDPLDPQGRSFYYQSDGGYFVLKTQAPVDLAARLRLSCRSEDKYTFSKEQAAKNQQKAEEARRKLEEWRRQRTPTPKPAPLVEECLWKMNVLHMALNAHKQDYGRFPETLAVLMSAPVKRMWQGPGEKRANYFDFVRSIADTLAREASAKGGMPPPAGYLWHYETREDGQHYFLGLRRTEAAEREIDAQNMPIAWSRLPGTVWPPGPRAVKAAQAFFENRPVTEEETIHF